MGLHLTEYTKWRESFVGTKRNTIITDDGNCEGYLELEEEDYYKKYFFILNIQEMKLKRYNENPKKYPRVICSAKDLVDIKYISKVVKSTKSKRGHSFEIHAAGRKEILSAKTVTEQNYWVTALTKAAVNPTQEDDDISSKMVHSMESLDLDEQSYTTSIIGGVVVKTPVCATNSGRTSEDASDNIKNKTNKNLMKSIKEGWCWKQGLRMKNWKRRFFRLNTIKLSYFENDEVDEPIRSIPSSNIQNVRILARFCGRDDMIEVETPDRKFYMHIEDEKDRMDWKGALETIMIDNGKFIPHAKSV